LNDKKWIYLTGATGFVGRHVLAELIAQGYHIYCLISGKTFIHELEHPQVQYAEIDFLAEEFEQKVNDFLSKRSITTIIHSAWYTEHEDYLTNSVNLKWVNSSKILIDAFYKHGGKRFIGLGTCVEYDFSSLNGSPIATNTPLKGNTLYATSKIAVFNYLNQLHQAQGIDYVWARLFFIYGAYDKKGRLIPYIYDQILRGKLAVPKFGGAKRDYIYVNDLAKQIASIIPNSYIGALNLGTEQAFKIQEIFDSVGRIMQKKHLIVKNEVFSHNTEYEPISIVADLKEWHSIEQDFDMTALAEGLQHTVAWMREHYPIVKNK
jgi:nucleoside-diphosphate-sugar epimerase